MEARNVQSNVVVVARQFNPAIFDKFWLVNNNVIAEEDFKDNCMFTPMVSQIFSANFNLLVLPDQLQFAPVPGTENAGDLVVSKVGAIVEKLPHTPYIAAGLNFIWHIDSEPQEFGSFSRFLFYKEDNPLYHEFNSEDARFGAYFSKNILGCRLRLDIKPVIQKGKTGEEERLQFSFNYHRDLSSDKKVNEILDLLDNWNEAEALVTKTVNSVIEGGKK